MKKILFATIVPFWNRSTGAEQRIFSLVRVLQSDGWQVRIFFPGQATDSDRTVAADSELDVKFASSDQMPAAVHGSLLGNLRWQLGAIKHALTKFLSRDRKPATPEAPTAVTTPSVQRLEDFHWPWASEAFNVTVREFAPAAIVCEYITTAYLISGLPKTLRASTHCLVDTHDLLSERQQQFANHGQPHWIEVSPEEEAEALSLFDTVIAIQSEEATKFQTMVAPEKVIVVGHQPDSRAIKIERRVDSHKLTLGYLGSNNSSNVDAISQFLEIVWSGLGNVPGLELLIAGSVCEGLLKNGLGSTDSQGRKKFVNVRMVATVDNVADFYQQTDAVVNPVGYGTGLKIKSVEAIAFNRPLICTQAGWSGDVVDGVVLVSALEEMTAVLETWAEDRSVFDSLRESLVEARSESQAASDEAKETPYSTLLRLLTGLVDEPQV